MRIKPLNDILLIELDQDEWREIKKPSILHIPDAVIGRYTKRANSGKIVRVGSKCRFKYEEGDRVRFEWYDKRPGFQESGKDYRFVQECELIAKYV